MNSWLIESVLSIAQLVLVKRTKDFHKNPGRLIRNVLGVAHLDWKSFAHCSKIASIWKRQTRC
jgi:hypothetical protein